MSYFHLLIFRHLKNNKFNKIFYLKKGSNLIGSNPSCDICFRFLNDFEQIEDKQLELNINDEESTIKFKGDNKYVYKIDNYKNYFKLTELERYKKYLIKNSQHFLLNLFVELIYVCGNSIPIVKKSLMEKYKINEEEIKIWLNNVKSEESNKENNNDFKRINKEYIQIEGETFSTVKKQSIDLSRSYNKIDTKYIDKAVKDLSDVLTQSFYNIDLSKSQNIQNNQRGVVVENERDIKNLLNEEINENIFGIKNINNNLLNEKINEIGLEKINEIVDEIEYLKGHKKQKIINIKIKKK